MSSNNPRVKANTKVAGKSALGNFGGSGNVEKVRRARLTLTHFDVASVIKLALLLSAGLLVATVAAGIFILAFMNVTGIMESFNGMIKEILGSTDQNFNIRSVINFGSVSGVMLLLGVLNAIIITFTAAVGAVIYNIATRLVGGVRITLTDD